MGYHGLGNDGLFRGIDGSIAKWRQVQVSGLNATFTDLTVTNLTVLSGANIPAFDILTVNVGGTSSLGTIVSGLWNGDVITELFGGTAQGSYNAGDILFSDSVDGLATLASGDEGTSLRIEGGALSWSALLEELYGGTGQSVYAPGDILYADAINSLTVLPSGAEGDSLKIIGGALAWGP